MVVPQKMTLNDLIEVNPLRVPQFIVIGLCALVTMIIGFDTQIIGLAATQISTAWSVPIGRFGPIFSAGLAGQFLGGPFFGAISDRLGRKPTMLIAVCAFGLAALATPLCRSTGQLGAVLALTGFGLGGALTTAIALASEYAPQRLRATLVSMMFWGFPLGAVLCALLAAKMLSAYGWMSIFYLGGTAPMAMLPILALLLPESARFLAHRRPEQLERLLRRWNWSERWNGESGFVVEQARSSILGLFSDGKAGQTALLWATLFCSMLLTFLLMNWIPLVALRSGIDRQGAVLAVGSLNLGSIFGSFTLGRISDRWGGRRTIGIGFLLGALAVVCLGLNHGSTLMLVAFALMVGFFCIGSQVCTVALSPSFYDINLRATGVGAAMAAGSLGAIVGPLIGGAVLAAGLSQVTLFVMVGVVPLVAAITMGLLSAAGQACDG